MEEKMSLGKYSLMTGVTIGAVAVVITLLEKIESLSSIVSILRFILLVSMAMYFIRMYRDRYNGGYISTGKIISLSLLMFMCVGVIAAIYIYIQTSMVPPSTYDEMVIMIKDAYEEQGIVLPEENWDDVVSMIPYVTAFMIFMGHILLGGLVGGIASVSMRGKN